ncbi:hypothetical protein E2C01_070391 [Portunus trituberculatus]|uniref:Uncharacterized protein n=1 Tax=Portunus trituberculatus TaxID=210409 RepID=A0A5B7HU15_PORTR|nr:hypothetical protein [Portunus trituberculatus]
MTQNDISRSRFQNTVFKGKEGRRKHYNTKNTTDVYQCPTAIHHRGESATLSTSTMPTVNCSQN